MTTTLDTPSGHRQGRPYPVVSTDNHINEPADFWDRLPADVQHVRPRFDKRDGQTYLIVDGAPPHRTPTGTSVDEWRALGLDDYTLQKNHRSDPTRGLDHMTRLREQGRDGVDGEILYPNLAFSMYASSNTRYQEAVAREYNNWVNEWVAEWRHRYVPAAMVPMLGDFDATIAELTRAKEMGFKTVAIPPAVPWFPYARPEYDVLWSAYEDLDLVLAFHVFTGNNFLGADFADVRRMDPVLFARGRELADAEDFSEGLQRTVIGMAAGMSPLVNLTSAGVFERHPNLKFVIVEAELGWLGWVLQAMDSMQQRRAHFMGYRLPQRASDYFRRQGYVTFTDDLYGMLHADFIGVDRILWSNDYPHDEGTFLESEETIRLNLGHLTEREQRLILWENAAQLYDLDATPLLADRAKWEQNQDHVGGQV